MKKKVNLILLGTALLYLFLAPGASAQGIMSDYMGRPVFEKRYTDVKGSPYLSDEWIEGSVKLENGKAFQGVKLKYDQVADELMFLDASGKEQLFVDPVLEFRLGDKLFRRGYPAADGASPAAYYEVLTEGKTDLLKLTSKKVFEETPYNSATKIRTIRANESYYIGVSNLKLTKIRKDKKSLLAALDGKGAELEAYIKSNRLDLKQDSDMVRLVNYYNTLK